MVSSARLCPTTPMMMSAMPYVHHITALSEQSDPGNGHHQSPSPRPHGIRDPNLYFGEAERRAEERGDSEYHGDEDASVAYLVHTHAHARDTIHIQLAL